MDRLAPPLKGCAMTGHLKRDNDVSPIWDLPATSGYLTRIGATPRSLKRAVVIGEKVEGYSTELAEVRFVKGNAGWEVNAPPGYGANAEELPHILSELANAPWPEWRPVHPFDKNMLPQKYRSRSDEDIYLIRAPIKEGGTTALENDRRGEEQAFPVLMVQVRGVPPEPGKKPEPKYVTLTFWSDNRWRLAEPERKLPVFGLEQLAIEGNVIAFLHEGAKAARHSRRIAAAYMKTPSQRSEGEIALSRHPWARDLAYAVHLGWLGGASRVQSTDWHEFNQALARGGIQRVIVVSDNDASGRKALPQISQRLALPVEHVIFPATFPQGFDLADDPSQIKGGWPTMSECLQPGTWMTRKVPGEKGKLIQTLTDAARAQWAYIPEARLYVNIRQPQFAFNKEGFNAFARALSDAVETSRLVEAAPYDAGRPIRVSYDPGKTYGIVTDGEVIALNRHRPGPVLTREGGAAPFLEYMEHLICDPSDRKELLRWVATLVAKPGTRMAYSVLLISNQQGVGKSTLGTILADLIGRHNVSFPSEATISSPFNEWIFEKRLAVINEVYAGAQWKIYNQLKTAITEKTVELNRKYQAAFTVQNWLHILACSNSSRPLKLDGPDRRWFVPLVTEKMWPSEKFAALYRWLNSGGLGEVLHWARSQVDDYYVKEGEHAPASAAKEEVIAESLSDAAKLLVRHAAGMTESPEPRAITLSGAMAYARKSLNQRVNEGEKEMAAILKRHGGLVRLGRLRIDGPHETVLGNNAAVETAAALQGDDLRAWLRKITAEPI